MQFIEKHKRKIILAAAAFLVLVAVLTQNRTHVLPAGGVVGFVVTPLQKAATNIADLFTDSAELLFTRRDLQAENENLQERIEELEAENARLQLYAVENERLNALLSLEKQYGSYETTGAHVIAKDPGNWFDTFLLDKGGDEGLKADMALMTAEGLVGKTVSIGSGFAKCRSLLDPNSSVSAMSRRTGDLGVVKGDYSLMSRGLCRMEYIDAEAQIVVGDEIITSNLSDIFPAGITIGVIKEIVEESNGLTKYAVVEPAADLKHLDSLLVVLGKAGDSQ